MRPAGRISAAAASGTRLPARMQPRAAGRTPFARHRRTIAQCAACALAAGIFLFDTLSPLEIAIASLYLVVVSLAATYLDIRSVRIAAAASIALTVLSLLLQHGFDFRDDAPLRAAVSLAAIAMASLLALKSLAANERLAASERQRTNLARFFSPQVVDELARTDQPLSLTRHQAAAVLFVDVVGFTTYSAKMGPEEVITLLRELLALLGDRVFANHGIVDKYLGDGLLAVFGAPLQSSADSANAATCALEMVRSVRTWNERHDRSRGEAIRVAIGIAYGHIVQGDVGSENRLELTVVGHAVNIASRIERFTRSLDATVLVTASLIDALRAEHRSDLADSFADFGKHRLRGYANPVQLYGVADVACGCSGSTVAPARRKPAASALASRRAD